MARSAEERGSPPVWQRQVLTVALFVLVAALISAVWLRVLTDRPPTEEVMRLIGLGALPGLAVALVRGWLAVIVWPATFVVALMLAAGEAVDLSVSDARPGDSERDFFGPVVDVVELGLRDFYSTNLPFDRISHPEMTSLVLLSLFLFVAATGALLAARRLTLASAVLLVAVGWPATMIANVDASALAVGTILLAVVLLVLYLARSGRRPLGGVLQAAVLGAVLLLAGVGLSTSSAVAKQGVLDWRSWSPYEKNRGTVGVRYVWNTSYAGIHWPDDETVVLRVTGPTTNVFWRATSLDEYTGLGWIESLERGDVTTDARLDLDRDPLLPVAARVESDWLRQDVTVGALADDHLIAAGQPVRWQLAGGAPVQPAESGVVFLPEELVPGQAYTVWSYAPDLSPDDLIDLEPDYPRAVLRYLEILPGVALPPFGARNRAERVETIFDEQRETASQVVSRQHESLYRQALNVVGTAPTPYLVALGLEQWFRDSGGFTYNELPPRPSGNAPPLVEFVLESRQGYCQQYAGAMALMLRMMGVPSRIAAGFVSGDFDEDTGVWTVTDRDAHTWVEVWFPEFGWLSFNPTPSRGNLGEAYSVSSEAFDLSAEGGGAAAGAAVASNDDLAQIFAEALLQFGQLGVGGSGLFSAPGSIADGSSAATTGSSGFPAWAVAILVVLAAIAVLLLAKLAWRHARLRVRDPRRAATAVRRDVVGFLADQRLELPTSLTLQEVGKRIEARYRVNSEAFVDSTSAARFGAPDESEPAADRAWSEHRQLIRALRRELGLFHRTRGLFAVRSLLPRPTPGLSGRPRQRDRRSPQRA